MKYVCLLCKGKPPLILTRHGIREHVKEHLEGQKKYGKKNRKEIHEDVLLTGKLDTRRNPLSKYYKTEK